MKFAVSGVISVLVACGAFLFSARNDGLLHIYFLDIGQGDAILLRTPKGKNILVDGGPGSTVLSELSEALPYFDSKIDYLISTHPDKDHIEGLIYVLRRHEVDNVIFTGVHKNDYLSKAFFKEVRDKNIPVLIAEDDSDFYIEEDVLLDFLFPFERRVSVEKVTNNLSLYAKVIYGTHQLLLTADAEWEEEEILLKNNVDLHAEILKVGHHGSKTSTYPETLARIKPTYAAISVGKGNSYGHPHPSVMQRLKEAGIKIYRTDQDGRVEFVLNKKEIRAIKKEH